MSTRSLASSEKSSNNNDYDEQLIIPRATTASSTCYRLDGTAVASSELVPCNAVLAAEGQGSMCCSMGLSSQNDTCDPTGLCKNDGSYYRDSCTDATWSSPNCLQNVCTDSGDYGSNVSFTLLYGCGTVDGKPSFCCGNGRSDCCGNSTATFTLAPTLVAQGASGATATVTVSSSATSSSNNSMTSNTSQSQNSNSGTSGATIGLAAALGVVSLASLIGFFLLGRKWRSHSRAHSKEGADMGYTGVGFTDQSFSGTPPGFTSVPPADTVDSNTHQGFYTPPVPPKTYNAYHEVPASPTAVELSSGHHQGSNVS